MDFLKRHWSTLLLIVIVAFWGGIRMGTDRCPSCVVSNITKKIVGADKPAEVPKKAVEKPRVSDWRTVDTKGIPISHEDLHGKVGVFVYWATWCNGCRVEIPDLIALRKEFPESQVEVVGLSVDEAHKDLEAFAREHGINYRLARVTDSISQAFGEVDAIPTLFILDQQGRIQFRHTGLVRNEAISERVRSLLPPLTVAGQTDF